MSGFGERLRMLRKKKGVTAAQLASVIGMTGDEVCKMERNMRGKTLEKLPALAKALGCRIDDLFPEMDNVPDIGDGVLVADWKEAKRHLDMMMAEYVMLGAAGSYGLYLGLVPLRKRYDSGERTLDLYDSIMALE